MVAQSQRTMRVSQQDLDDPVPLDYKIPKFSIILQPTPHRITDDMVAAVLSPILEATLFDSLGGVQTQSNRLLLAQAYVEDQDGKRRVRRSLLTNDTIATNSTTTDTTNTFNNTNTTTPTNLSQTTKIIVKGGLVSFKRTPPLEKVPEVIEDGINYKLVNKLPKDSIFFGPIEKATYVKTQNQPPPASLNPEDDENNGQPTSNPPDELVTGTLPPYTSPTAMPGSDSSNMDAAWFSNFPWIKVIAAPIIILMGIGLLLLARKKRLEAEKQRHQQLKENSFETQESNVEDDDAKSISEWTTATTETQNHQFLAKSQYLASEETFERNSRLAVKKDMLESEWSAYNPNARATSTSLEAATETSESSKRSLV